MSEYVIPIPDDIRHLVLTLWGAEDYEKAMSSEQRLLDHNSIRQCIADGRSEDVRRVLRQLVDGVYL